MVKNDDNRFNGLHFCNHYFVHFYIMTILIVNSYLTSYLKILIQSWIKCYSRMEVNDRRYVVSFSFI
jgi:hypothetical protein